jgi:hypothetical protein
MTGLSEPEMSPIEHRARALSIPGGNRRTPRRIASLQIEPTNQVAHRATHRAGLSGGVQGREVEAPRGRRPAGWLALDLDQVVFTGEECWMERNRVHCRRRHGWSTSGRTGSRAGGALAGSQYQKADCGDSPHGFKGED